MSADVATIATSADVLKLPTLCTISAVEQLRALLLQRIEEPEALRLDATAVERIDTAGLQLLIAFLRDRKARQAKVIWVGCSDPLLRAAQTLGVHGWFLPNPS